ncbi:MAG: hypothetical protein HUU41_02040 [Bryobacteraceae bacterium]|nr:hypothetical protein [Bryobacterales bacterium]MEB2360213.1 hypothetical protein [Bryobacterales bacterium]NUM99869.1 hypothetical protein [Bryobacteraceae bacterium]
MIGADRIDELAAPFSGRRLPAKLAGFLLLLGALIATRLPLMPKYLITFDAINFALAVERFDPSLHQPQPPGYPAFVLLLRAIACFVPGIEAVFSVTALLSSWLALILVQWLGALMINEKAGWITALLLLFNPPFWLAALTNPIRLWLATGAVMAVIAVKLMERPALSVKAFYAAAIILGAISGFRPVLPALLLPVVALAAWRHRIRPLHWILAGTVGAAAAAGWFAFTAASVGGIEQYIQVLLDYNQQQAEPTSLLYGAMPGAAVYMALQAITWTGLGVLSWIWSVPFARRTAPLLAKHDRWLLLVWFFPAFLFYATVHVGDPDHTLSIIPVTCLLGAAVLLRAVSGKAPRVRFGVIAAAVVLNAFLFYKPISKVTKPATYTPVAWLDGHIRTLIDGLLAAGTPGSVAAVFYEPTTGWRNLSYYCPNIPVLVIPGNVSREQLAAWYMHDRRVRAAKVDDGAIVLPPVRRAVFVDMAERPISASPALPVSCAGRLCTVQLKKSGEVRFHGFRFRITGSTRGQIR